MDNNSFQLKDTELEFLGAMGFVFNDDHFINLDTSEEFRYVGEISDASNKVAFNTFVFRGEHNEIKIDRQDGLVPLFSVSIELDDVLCMACCNDPSNRWLLIKDNKGNATYISVSYFGNVYISRKNTSKVMNELPLITCDGVNIQCNGNYFNIMNTDYVEKLDELILPVFDVFEDSIQFKEAFLKGKNFLYEPYQHIIAKAEVRARIRERILREWAKSKQ